MPYPGQGVRIPSSTGVEGEWIIEGGFFLVVGIDGSLTPDRPIVTHAVTLDDGRRCRGFNAEVLAMKLGINGNYLLDLNRNGDITLNVVAPIAPGYPGNVFVRTPSKIFRIEVYDDDAARN